MTTYQNLVDYLNKYYGAGFKLFYNNPGCTINNNDDRSISIDKDSYSTTIIIDKGLNKLLTDILNTPVNQRDKPEIKHTIKPVTKSNLEKREIKCSDSADEIIARINSFILKDFNIDNSRSLLLLTAFKTTFNPSELLQVLSIFKDFDITIKDTKKYAYPKEYFYTLSIKAK